MPPASIYIVESRSYSNATNFHGSPGSVPSAVFIYSGELRGGQLLVGELELPTWGNAKHWWKTQAVFLSHCSCHDPWSRWLVLPTTCGWGLGRGKHMFGWVWGELGQGELLYRSGLQLWLWNKFWPQMEMVPFAVPLEGLLWQDVECVHCWSVPCSVFAKLLSMPAARHCHGIFASAYHAQLSLWQSKLSSPFGINVSLDLKKGSAGLQPGARVASQPCASPTGRGDLRVFFSQGHLSVWGGTTLLPWHCTLSFRVQLLMWTIPTFDIPPCVIQTAGPPVKQFQLDSDFNNREPTQTFFPLH